MENGLLLEAEAWAQITFGDARLGDLRRSKRVVRIAALMARHPRCILASNDEIEGRIKSGLSVI